MQRVHPSSVFIDYDQIAPARVKLIEMFKANKSGPALNISNSFETEKDKVMGKL